MEVLFLKSEYILYIIISICWRVCFHCACILGWGVDNTLLQRSYGAEQRGGGLEGNGGRGRKACRTVSLFHLHLWASSTSCFRKCSWCLKHCDFWKLLKKTKVWPFCSLTCSRRWTNKINGISKQESRCLFKPFDPVMTSKVSALISNQCHKV